ncbi:MAG: putative glycoside hydrolase, partial [Vibrio sp.]
IGIDAVLINNNGQNDTADIQISGSGSHIFMLKSDPVLDLSQYQSGYLQFKLRAKSTLPSSLVVSIDNEWPNRSSLVVSKGLTGGGEWETLAIPVACMKPFDGATAVDLHSVKTPFHLDVQEPFDYEITDVEYLFDASSQSNVIDCGLESGSSSASINQAPDLQSTDIALYYSGNKKQATDYTSAYPVNSFGFDVQESNQVVHISTSKNGGVFLGNDQSDKNLSAYQDKFLNIDLKVKSYGESSELQVRMDGMTEDSGKFFAVDNTMLPANDTWYRCQLPISSLIPTSNLTKVRKALYLSGVWDSMSNLDFSFTNVAVRSQQDGYNPSSPCVKL